MTSLPAVVAPEARASASALALWLLLAGALSGDSAAAAAATAVAASVLAGNVSSLAAGTADASGDVPWPSVPAVAGDTAVAANSSEAPSTPGAAELDRATSLVPLFVLLAAFALIVVGCVALCQRLRSRHKDRFVGEQQQHHRPHRPRGSSWPMRGDCEAVAAGSVAHTAKYEFKGRRQTGALAEPPACLPCSQPLAARSPPLVRKSGFGGIDEGRAKERPNRATVTFADEPAMANCLAAAAAAAASPGEEGTAEAASRSSASLPTWAEGGALSAPTAGRPPEVKAATSGVADRIVVVKQIQGSKDLGRQQLQRLDSSSSTGRGSDSLASSSDGIERRRRLADAARLTTGTPELRVALLEDEELTIHSTDGRVFQVAVVRPSAASGSSLGAGAVGVAAAEFGNDLAGVHRRHVARQQQQQRARAGGAAKARRRRTVSDGPSMGKALAEERRRAAVAATTGGAGDVASLGGVELALAGDCPDVAASAERLAKAGSLELPAAASAAFLEAAAAEQQYAAPLLRPRSRPEVSSSSDSSSQDDSSESASLLTEEARRCSDAKLLSAGSFAASSAGDVVAEHGR